MDSKSSQRPRSALTDAQRKTLALISAIIVFGFFIAVAYHCIQATYFNRPYPNNTFLFVPGNSWTDFFHDMAHTRSFDPYSNDLKLGSRSNYGPFFHLLFYPLSLLEIYTSYIVYSAILLGILFVFLIKRIGPLAQPIEFYHAVTIFLFSYPFLFAWDRGNIETLIFLFIMGFFISLRRGKNHWSTFFLACAIVTKVYPAFYGALYFQRRQFKEIGETALWVVVMTVGGLAILKGGLAHNWQIFWAGFAPIVGDSINIDLYLQHGVSLYGALRAVITIFDPSFLSHANDQQIFFRAYAAFVLSSCIAMPLFMYIKRIPFFESVAILSTTMIIFVPVSFDYKMIHILFMVYFYVFDYEEKTHLMTCLLGVILIPKAYVMIREDISWSIVVNPVLMLILCLLVVTKGLRRKSGADLKVELSAG